jgi:hypothetical protein
MNKYLEKLAAKLPKKLKEYARREAKNVFLSPPPGNWSMKNPIHHKVEEMTNRIHAYGHRKIPSRYIGVPEVVADIRGNLTKDQKNLYRARAIAERAKHRITKDIVTAHEKRYMVLGLKRSKPLLGYKKPRNK